MPERYCAASETIIFACESLRGNLLVRVPEVWWSYLRAEKFLSLISVPGWGMGLSIPYAFGTALVVVDATIPYKRNRGMLEAIAYVSDGRGQELLEITL